VGGGVGRREIGRRERGREGGRGWVSRRLKFESTNGRREYKRNEREKKEKKRG